MKKEKLSANLPIGIFDSGVGGLTVVKKVKEFLPQENILYFADTANVPYGEKTAKQIQNWTLKISKFLVNSGIKLLLLGCNYSSAVSLALIKKNFKLKVLGLIEGGVQKAVQQSKNKIVGVIATTGTINSNAYQKSLKKYFKKVVAVPCPLLVPIIESGDLKSPSTLKILQQYLLPVLNCGADTLILGCTHYPFLIPAINKIAPDLKIIDPAEEIVKKGKEFLISKNLLNNENKKQQITYFTSGSMKSLLTVGKKFAGVKSKEIINIPLFYKKINFQKKLFLAKP